MSLYFLWVLNLFGLYRMLDSVPVNVPGSFGISMSRSVLDILMIVEG